MTHGRNQEWNCLEHGIFDSSHPICPNFGCESKFVTQEFRTAPTIGTSFRKRFDAGIRRSSDLMGGANFRTAKAGEQAFGGQAAKDAGTEVLWGDQSRKVLGRSFRELQAMAAQPLVVPKRDGSGVLRMDRNNGMADAANEVGITRRRLPKAFEVTADPAERAAAKALTV